MDTALIAALILLLAFAAWSDLLVRLIPDAVPLGILVLAVPLRLAAGGPAMLGSFGVAAILFAALLGLALRQWLGGGDVKLAAATAAALAPEMVPDFLLATILCGGALGVIYLAGPWLAPPLRAGAARAPRPLARLLLIEARRQRRQGPVPYGIAIAAGGTLLLLHGPGG
jgi:prepilin peptidase CpaA